jgi:hypothetical protein
LLCEIFRFAKNKKDDQSNISIETLCDYFKNLNTNIDNDNNNIDIDINIDNLSPRTAVNVLLRQELSVIPL